MICPVCSQMTRDRMICSHCGAALDAPILTNSASSLATVESDDFDLGAAGGMIYSSGIGNRLTPLIRSMAIDPPVEPRAVGHLVVYLDNDSWGGTAVPLDERDVTIGRSTDCAMCLAHDPLVSNFHAVISFRGAGHALKDVGSSNGTLLNNVPIVGECPLHEGDVVRIGQCELVYSSAPHYTQAYSDTSPALPGSHVQSLEAIYVTSESGELAPQVVAFHASTLPLSLIARSFQYMLFWATGFRRFQTRVNKNARALAVNVRVKAPQSKRLK